MGFGCSILFGLRGILPDRLIFEDGNMNARSKPESKYDLRINPVYQVDFHSEASGKRVGATKRRIRFRFGFSNKEAILRGLSGTECRGEEHEISIVWSLTSGKRLILLDGSEVHFSAGKKAETQFVASFPLQNHIIKIICHATPPLRTIPGFRQFDMQLDGCSYFDMPRIFELGKWKVAGTSPVSPTFSQRSFGGNTSPRSVRFSHNLEQVKAIPSRFEDAAAAASCLDLLAECNPSDLLDSPRVAPEPQQYDSFTPVVPHVTQETKNRVILAAYSESPYLKQQNFPALANESHTYHQPVVSYGSSPGYQQPAMSPAVPSGYHQPTGSSASPMVSYRPGNREASWANQQQYQPNAAPSTPGQTHQEELPPVLTPTMEKLSLEELEEREQPPELSPLDRGLETLINWDDFDETKTTPEQRKAEQQKMDQSKPSSKPLARAEPAWNLGLNPSLASIQASKTKKEVRPDIMGMHAFDPRAGEAGMMVVYGDPPPVNRGYYSNPAHAQVASSAY